MKDYRFPLEYKYTFEAKLDYALLFLEEPIEMEDDVYLKLIYNYFKECSAAVLDLSSSKIILQDEMEKIVL